MLEIYQACFQDFLDWVIKGEAPPHAPPIEVENGQIVRDQYSNAKGGVRSPYVDVPAFRYFASTPPSPEALNMMAQGMGRQGGSQAAGAGEPGAAGQQAAVQSRMIGMFSLMVGLQEPLPHQTLEELYKSREYYLNLFNEGIDRMVAERFLLPADATRLKADEAAKPPL